MSDNLKHNIDERFFQLIFDSIGHGIFTIDSNSKITSFNSAAEKITGYSRKEVMGRSCHEIFRADICFNDCSLMKSIKSGNVIDGKEVIILKKNGQRLPISISTSALKDKNGKILGGIEMFSDLSVVWNLRKKIQHSYVYEDIISKSTKMEVVLDMLPLVANSPSTVLIEGASGTGKELIAKAIHNLSPRKSQPFVAINCGALPDDLLESELFGYKKGAFTGALKDKPGRLAIANKGTLFFDEVCNLSQAMQVKLLRVLQEKEYEPLGSNRTMQMDIRILAATNRDLGKKVKQGTFRQDLYFRLNVVKINLPPLVARKEDIPLLVRHFIEQFNALQGRRINRCSDKAISALMKYNFPGNVRELENAIEHAFVLCTSEIIQFEDLPQDIISWVNSPENKKENDDELNVLKNGEAEIIRKILNSNKGNRTLTAKKLGVSRNTLWRKMKRYGITYSY